MLTLIVILLLLIIYKLAVPDEIRFQIGIVIGALIVPAVLLTIFGGIVVLIYIGIH